MEGVSCKCTVSETNSLGLELYTLRAKSFLDSHATHIPKSSFHSIASIVMTFVAYASRRALLPAIGHAPDVRQAGTVEGSSNSAPSV